MAYLYYVLFQVIKMLSIAMIYQAIGHFLTLIHFYR